MRIDDSKILAGSFTFMVLATAMPASGGVPGPRVADAVAAKGAAVNSAVVELPPNAAAFVRIRTRDGFAFGFRALDAHEVTGHGGRFARAVAIGGDDFDLSLREIDGGVEDFVELGARPSRESVAYEVDVSSAAGLRLVDGVLELLDTGGAPRARMRQPYLVDADGSRHPADVRVTGCAYDASGVAPFRRAVTPPGAASCHLEIRWGAAIGDVVGYPAVLDPAWVDGGTLVHPRNAHTAALVADGTVLVAGGYLAIGTSGYSNVAEIFDPTTGTWAAAHPMTRPRAHTNAVTLASGSLAGQVLVAGGDDALQPSADLFDPATGDWTATAAMNAGRDGLSVALLGDGTAIAAGGCSAYSSTCTTEEASAEIYDPEADTWTATTSPMSSARWAFSLTSLADGRAIAAGGCDAFQPNFICTSSSSTSDVYDPADGSWKKIAMATPIQNHRAVLLSTGEVLAAGGASNGAIAFGSQVFDATGNAWSDTGALSFAHDEAGLAVLGTGAIFAGSWGTEQGFDVISRSTETYDPTTKTWSPTASLAKVHGNHTATTLADGRVLVAGGFDQPSPHVLGESGVGEIYDVNAVSGTGGAGGSGPASTAASTGSASGPSGPSSTTGSGAGPGSGSGGAGVGGGGGLGDTGTSNGCSCRVAGDPEGDGALLAIALGAAAALVRRRNRAR